MISYEVRTDIHTEIYYDDEKIGHIERYNFSKYYIVEVDYFRFRVAFKDRKRIPLLIVALHKSRVLRAEYIDKHKLASQRFITACRSTTDRSKFKILE